MNVEAKKGFFFGEFELDPDRRLLLKRGEAVDLKSKTFDLLLVLVENRHQVLTKYDLLDKVWENQFVEENNLTVHVAALRKALGETKNDHRFIVTVPGKGYRFVAALNQPSNREIVVASHKFERIVVEEEIEERSSDADWPATIGSSSIQNVKSGEVSLPKRRTAIAVVAGLVVLAAIGGGYALRERLSANVALHVPFVRHTMRQLTTNGKVGKAALSPDGKLFAYTVDDIGQKSLWLGYVDGGNHLLLRQQGETIYRTLAFSPDGSNLYFSISDDKNPKGALFKLPVLGGVPQKVMDRIGSFSLSPDGRHIVTARADDERKSNFIVIVPLDGSNRRDVASFPKEQSFRFDTISWSADEKLFAMSTVKEGKPSGHEVMVVDAATGEVKRIAHEPLGEISKTAWTQDGSGLVITAVGPASYSSVPQYLIWHMAYPGGELNQITTDRSNYGASWHNDAGVTLSLSAAGDLLLAVEHRQLSNVWVAPYNDLSAARQITFSSFGKYDGLWGLDWTPDGTLIYTTSDTHSQFLSHMNADGSDQRAITSPGMIDSVLTVSVDGRYVFFHSNRGGDFDIWRMDIDGANLKQLTFGGQGFQPFPSPDGRWVYYKSWLKGLGELRRVPIDGGESETLNAKETSWGSFSPDGKYFAASYVTDKQRLAIFSSETHEMIRQFELPKTGTLFMGSRWTPDSNAVTYRDNAYGYWIQPIDGGELRRLEGLPKEKFYNFSFSKDGKWFAFVRGQEIRDVVLFKTSLE